MNFNCLVIVIEIIVLLSGIHFGSTDGQECQQTFGTYADVDKSLVYPINKSRTFGFKMTERTIPSELLRLYLLPSERPIEESKKSLQLDNTLEQTDVAYMQIVPASPSRDEHGGSIKIPLILSIRKSMWTKLHLSEHGNRLQICSEEGNNNWCFVLAKSTDSETWTYVQFLIPARNYLIVDFCADKHDDWSTFLQESNNNHTADSNEKFEGCCEMGICWNYIATGLVLAALISLVFVVIGLVAWIKCCHTEDDDTITQEPIDLDMRYD